MLLIFAASICVLGMLIYSVTLYSRELGAKTSYLTFMTPNSAVKILGSKLLSALVLGLFFASILTGFGAWDIQILSRTFPEIQLGHIMLEQVLKNMAATDLATLVTTVLAAGVQFLINFFSVVVVAYLAITLSATALQNKKFKGLVSFLLFIGIMTLLQWVVSLLPSAGLNHRDMLAAMTAAWPQYAVYLVVMAGSFALSAWLLENKVSL
jgi:ABC-2 type transport system permease protein